MLKIILGFIVKCNYMLLRNCDQLSLCNMKFFAMCAQIWNLAGALGVFFHILTSQYLDNVWCIYPKLQILVNFDGKKKIPVKILGFYQ